MKVGFVAQSVSRVEGARDDRYSGVITFCIYIENISKQLYNAFYAILSSKYDQVTRNLKESAKRSIIDVTSIILPLGDFLDGMIKF